MAAKEKVRSRTLAARSRSLAHQRSIKPRGGCEAGEDSGAGLVIGEEYWLGGWGRSSGRRLAMSRYHLSGCHGLVLQAVVGSRKSNRVRLPRLPRLGVPSRGTHSFGAVRRKCRSARGTYLCCRDPVSRVHSPPHENPRIPGPSDPCPTPAFPFRRRRSSARPTRRRRRSRSSARRCAW